MQFIILLAILIIINQRRTLLVVIPYIEKKDSQINEELIVYDTLPTLYYASANDVLIVASVSCIYGIGSVDDYGDYLRWLKWGKTCSRQSSSGN